MTDKFFPDIFEYLSNIQNSKSVTGQGLEEIVLRVAARTGLSPNVSKEIVVGFFQEIRNAMLRGDIITIRGLGKFLLAKPSNSTNKKKMFAKFKPYNKFIERLNHEC